MTVDRAGIERLVPHAGAMLLLDTIVQWDATHIGCLAAAPDARHPFARDGRVPSVTAAEYAAQAAAVHGALIDGQTAPRHGMLAKLSEVELHTACLPMDCGPVAVNVELRNRGAAGCVYTFDVACARRVVASGRLLVAFAPPSAQ